MNEKAPTKPKPVMPPEAYPIEELLKRYPGIHIRYDPATDVYEMLKEFPGWGTQLMGKMIFWQAPDHF